MKHLRSTFLASCSLLALSSSSFGTVIAFWDFNDGYVVPDESPQIVHSASIGSGTIYQQRADTDGNGKDGIAFTDTENGIDVSDGQAMAWDDIAKSGDNDAEFFIVFSTAGYTDITISFDLRGNDGIIPGYDLKFSLATIEDVTDPGDVVGTIKDFADGISSEIYNNQSVNATASYSRIVVDLSATTELNDESYVVLRFDDWQNGTGNDDMRIDNLLITGTPVPEPSGILLGALGLLGLLRRRR